MYPQWRNSWWRWQNLQMAKLTCLIGEKTTTFASDWKSFIDFLLKMVKMILQFMDLTVRKSRIFISQLTMWRKLILWSFFYNDNLSKLCDCKFEISLSFLAKKWQKKNHCKTWSCECGSLQQVVNKSQWPSIWNAIMRPWRWYSSRNFKEVS